MFCNNCGKKIKAGAVRCSCGAPVEQMEYCGGFWGLVGKKPEKPRRNDVGEKPNSQPPMERSSLNSGYTGSENAEKFFESGERRSRSSGSGIGLAIGGIMAGLVLIGGGALLFMRKGKPVPSSHRTVAEDTSKAAEETELSGETAEVSKGQLEYQYKYVKLRIREMEEQERLLKDPNSPELEDREQNEQDWEDFKSLVGAEGVEDSISQEFEQFKSDYLSYANQDLSFNKTKVDKLDKKLHLAQLDLRLHEEFPAISINEDGSGYEWGNNKEVDANVKMAKEIINEYEKLQLSEMEETSGTRDSNDEKETFGPEESYLKHGTFASNRSLLRMEALLYDYCIDYYKVKLGVSDEKPLSLMTSDDYQTAKKNAGDDQEFEGEHDNLWYAEWCINDLENAEEEWQAARDKLKNLPEDAGEIRRLRDSDAGQDQEKDSASDSTLIEESTQESASTEDSAQEPASTEDLNKKDGRSNTVKNDPGFPFKR